MSLITTVLISFVRKVEFIDSEQVVGTPRDTSRHLETPRTPCNIPDILDKTAENVDQSKRELTNFAKVSESVKLLIFSDGNSE